MVEMIFYILFKRCDDQEAVNLVSNNDGSVGAL